MPVDGVQFDAASDGGARISSRLTKRSGWTMFSALRSGRTREAAPPRDQAESVRPRARALAQTPSTAEVAGVHSSCSGRNSAVPSSRFQSDAQDETHKRSYWSLSPRVLAQCVPFGSISSLAKIRERQ